MVAIVYARVSTEDQAREGYSLAAQREACRARALALGYRPEEVLELSDDGVSGDLMERPGLSRVRDLIRQGGVGHVICLDPDRLARRLTYQLILTEELERAGVQLDFVNFEWRNTPEGRLFYSLRGAIAEYEKEKIRERSMRGKRQKAKQGLLTHNIQTYGYVYDPATSMFQVDKSAARVVRQMYRWCADEEAGSNEIARRLNALAIPAPKGGTWLRSTVHRILRNPTYTGEIILQRYDSAGKKQNRFRPPEEKVRLRVRPEEEWIRVPVPAIVDQTLWDRAQRVQDVARRRYPGTAKHFYLLSGLCVCGLCGSYMYGAFISRTRREKQWQWRYYVCNRHAQGARANPRCGLPYTPAAKIEEEVWRRVCRWVQDPEELHRELRAMREEPEPDASAGQRELLEEQLAEVDRQRARLLHLYQKALAPAGELETRLGELAGREKALREALAAHRARPLQRSLPRLPSLRRVLAGVRARVDQMTPQERRELVRALVDRVVVRPDAISIHAQIPDWMLNHE
ncbi:MAG: recombinase family protein [Bacillota bacterium]|nr:recombinase family protein [Bacillota bacterium]